MPDSTLAFVPDGRREVVVNFGVHAGREATQAEVERLGASLQDHAPAFAIVAERRYGFGPDGDSALSQVRVELQPGGDPHGILPAVEAWASDCIAERGLL